MKSQWGILSALVVALIIAVFSVINVESVTVHYLFGTAQWPLILVIIVSVLLGALLVGVIGIFRGYKLQRELKTTKAELEEYHHKEQHATEDESVESEKEMTRASRHEKP